MDLGNCFLNIMFIHYIVDFETGIVKKVFFLCYNKLHDCNMVLLNGSHIGYFNNNYKYI